MEPPLAALERAPSNPTDFAAFVADRLQGAIYPKMDRTDRRKAQVLGAAKAAKSRQSFRHKERSGR